MSFVRLSSDLYACQQALEWLSYLLSPSSPINLWSTLLILLSLGRRLGTPLGFTGMETSQRWGVEGPRGAVPGSCTLGYLCCVDVYGLIYDQTSCALWSLPPEIIPARNKSKPSEWVLVAWLSVPKLHLLFLCVLWVDKFQWVLCHSCAQSALDKSSRSCKALPCFLWWGYMCSEVVPRHSHQGDSPGQAKVKLWLPFCLQGASWANLESPCPILAWISPKLVIYEESCVLHILKVLG